MADNSRTNPSMERDKLSSRPGMHIRHDFGSSGTSVLDTAKEKAEEIASGAGSMMSEAKDKVQEWASDAAEAANVVKDKAREYASTAYEQAGKVGENLTDLVRRYPIPALLIGFGLGFLAARMTRSLI
jgi:hypothetical protein